MNNDEAALQAHQASIRNNPHSVVSLRACADIYRRQETKDSYMRVHLALHCCPTSGIPSAISGPREIWAPCRR